ncbi:MAG: RNA polymerase sigma factor [Candidatus Cryptobacteroides sp.]
MEQTGLKPIDELTILAKNGNGLAFTALWDNHIEQLKAYLKSKFTSLDDYNVDDICSRTFEKAFRQINSYDHSRSRFLTWLCTIGRNTALDCLEHEGRIHPKNQFVSIDDTTLSTSMEGIQDQDCNALDNLIHIENEEEKTKYISRLPELYREVAAKRMIEGMKYNEIAECMDIELNTVKTRIRRAKQMIDAMRKEDEKEEL